MKLQPIIYRIEHYKIQLEKSEEPLGYKNELKRILDSTLEQLKTLHCAFPDNSHPLVAFHFKSRPNSDEWVICNDLGLFEHHFLGNVVVLETDGVHAVVQQHLTEQKFEVHVTNLRPIEVIQPARRKKQQTETDKQKTNQNKINKAIKVLNLLGYDAPTESQINGVIATFK